MFKLLDHYLAMGFTYAPIIAMLLTIWFAIRRWSQSGPASAGIAFAIGVIITVAIYQAPNLIRSECETTAKIEGTPAGDCKAPTSIVPASVVESSATSTVAGS